MSARVKVARGALYGTAYLAVEGVGIVVITKLVASRFGLEVAGFFTIICYMLALSNVVVTSLGLAVTRSIASSGARSFRFDVNVRSGRFLAAFFLFLLSFIYIGLMVFLYMNESATRQYVLVCFLFGAGHILRLAGLYKCFEFLGRGVVGIDRLHQLIFSLVYGLVAIIVLYLGGGLLDVSWVYLLVGVLSLCLAKHYEYRFSLLFVSLRPSALYSPSFMRKKKIKMARDAGAFLFNSANGFIIMNSDVFIVGFIFGASVLAEYSLYSRLASLIVAVGGSVPMMYFPLIAKSWSEGQVSQCVKYRLDGIKFGFVFIFISGLLSIFIYPEIVDWTFSGAREIPGWFVGLPIVYAAISIHTAVNGMPVIAVGRHFFAKLAFLNALMVVIFSFFGGYYFGLVGVPLGAIAAGILPTILYRKKSLEVFS